jgi:hypothetical protein
MFTTNLTPRSANGAGGHAPYLPPKPRALHSRADGTPVTAPAAGPSADGAGLDPLDGMRVSIEAALFPFLFPQGKGVYQWSTVAGHRLSDYLYYRLTCPFTIFTLYTPYLLYMYAIRQTYILSGYMSEVALHSEIERIKEREPEAREDEVLRDVMKHRVFSRMPGTPAYFADNLQDLLCMVQHRGMPSLFLTLTEDEVSKSRWSEIDDLEAFLDKYAAQHASDQRLHACNWSSLAYRSQRAASARTPTVLIPRPLATACTPCMLQPCMQPSPHLPPSCGRMHVATPPSHPLVFASRRLCIASAFSISVQVPQRPDVGARPCGAHPHLRRQGQGLHEDCAQGRRRVRRARTCHRLRHPLRGRAAAQLGALAERSSLRYMHLCKLLSCHVTCIQTRRARRHRG